MVYLQLQSLRLILFAAGTPGLPQQGAQQMPLSAVADRTDPHFGEDFGHLDSMLASDAFDDQPDHPGAQPPADGRSDSVE